MNFPFNFTLTTKCKQRVKNKILHGKGHYQTKLILCDCLSLDVTQRRKVKL